MKLNKIFVKLLAGAAAIGLGASAFAQGDYDWYALDKSVAFQFTNTAINAATVSNNTAFIDVAGKFIGSGYIDVFCSTNGGTNSVSITPFSSPDQTNLTAFSYALSTNVSTIYTNAFYSGSNTNNPLLATNYDVFPFIITTPIAYLAGFATQYPAPIPFTNTGAFTPYGNGFGSTNFTRIGIQSMIDLPHYICLGVREAGTNEIFAVLHGRRR